MPGTPTTVLVVDDHALFRDGLIALIGRWDDFEVAGSASDGAEAIQLARRLRPQLVLMDVRMAGMGGVEATSVITAADPEIRVVMLTMSNLGEDVYQALRNGALGYLSKDEPADRLQAVHREHPWVDGRRSARTPRARRAGRCPRASWTHPSGLCAPAGMRPRTFSRACAPVSTMIASMLCDRRAAVTRSRGSTGVRSRGVHSGAYRTN